VILWSLGDYEHRKKLDRVKMSGISSQLIMIMFFSSKRRLGGLIVPTDMSIVDED